LTLSACGQSERPILERFFGASRLRDLTALQPVATIVFEPLQQGIVRTFEITGVSPERSEGEAIVKDVTIEAPVALPDGQTVQKTLVVTLSRRAVRMAPDVKDIRGGSSNLWIVTAVRDAGASRPVPRS
jgi:hypothetical protein